VHGEQARRRADALRANRLELVDVPRRDAKLGRAAD
jgi:hypothetical protein